MDGKGEMPTAAALALARACRRVAVKHQDLSLLGASKDLEKRALSAVKRRQSVLSNDTSHQAEQSERSSGALARAKPSPDDVWGRALLQGLEEVLREKRSEKKAK
jgi:hypothetical protein